MRYEYCTKIKSEMLSLHFYKSFAYNSKGRQYKSRSRLAPLSLSLFQLFLRRLGRSLFLFFDILFPFTEEKHVESYLTFNGGRGAAVEC